MVSLEQIKWIRLKKQEFKELFSEELIIQVKNRSPKLINDEDVKRVILELSIKYNVNLELFFLNRVKKKKPSEHLFIMDFGNYILENKLSLTRYASFINRDRSTIMYHLNK